MTQLPPDQPLGAPSAAPPKEKKAASASVLAAPRPPVVRWSRKAVILAAGGLASVLAVGFWVGFNPTPAQSKASPEPQQNGDAQTSQAAISGRFEDGYGGVLGQAPGTATLPPPGTPLQGAPPAVTPAAYDPAMGGAPPPQQPVDPRVQAAREQAFAARAASPFFGGAQPPGPQGSYGGNGGQDGPPGYPIAPPGWQPPGVGEVQPGNGQTAKRQFADSARADDYLQNSLRPPLSPWEVKAGSIISAALLTALNSDLPGEVVAQVTQPVYDHVTGRTVLIPQGSRLIGRYDSQVAYGQNRALVAWNRIIMPDGRSINIGSMTGADATGAAGLNDKVDQHTWQLARGIFLSTVFSVGAAAAQDASARSSGSLVVNSGLSGISQSAQQVGQQITARDLQRQPTLRVRAGFPVRVIVNKDMILAPYPQ